MGTSIRDLLTSFSPSLDYLAISSGDGRIKIWDTLKGQIQTEFADIAATDASIMGSEPIKGHLSIDYTCMKWLSSETKKKRKNLSSLLILGTGGGDVLALDVASGQLRWRVSDCHPGGVSAVSFPSRGSCIYTTGADGMLCELDSSTGNLLRKFKASTKGISFLSVSSDGKILATAAGQLKILDSSDHKKIKKFSGHPGAVRCMVFTEGGKYILSSAVGERYIAVWKLNGEKKSASCVLSMEHPAVFLDSRLIKSGGVGQAGIYILAISEIGICYYWYGQNLDGLRNSKPTKVSLSSEEGSLRNHKGVLPTIFAAKLQGIAETGSGQVFVAHGSLVKPIFQKIVVNYGTDIKLSSSGDGVLLPISQSLVKTKRGLDVPSSVTALDRSNAEDALLPIPKVFDAHEKSKNRHQAQEEAASLDGLNQSELSKTGADDMEIESPAICIEDQLRSFAILDSKDDVKVKITSDSSILKGIDLEADLPRRKLRAAVLAMAPADAYRLLGVLVALWQSRSCREKFVLPWIHSLLLYHSHHIISQEQGTQNLDSLFKITQSRGTAVQPLTQLLGRLKLVTAQIDRASYNKSQTLNHDIKRDAVEDEIEDEKIEDILYGEEDDESEISSDDDK